MSDDPLDTILEIDALLNPTDSIYAKLHSPLGGILFYAFPITIVLAGIVMGLAYLAPHGNTDQAIGALGIFVTLAVFAKYAIVIGILLYPLYMVWHAADPSKIKRHLFTKDGLELISESGSSLLPWSSISRAIETSKGFLFYQGSKLVAFLPRRSLQGPAEIGVIRKFVSTYVAGAKLLS